MPRIVKPQRLQPGWLNRTVLNGLKLSLRQPLLWCLLYLGPTYFAIKATTAMHVYITLAWFPAMAGIVVALKYDRQQEVPWWTVVKRVFGQPMAWLFLLTALVVIGYLPGPSEKSLWYSYPASRLGIAIMMLVLLQAGTHLTLFLWFLRRLKNGQVMELALPLSSFMPFIVADIGGDWRQAGKLAFDGFIANIDHFVVLVLFVMLPACVVPVWLGVVIPMGYCLYKEIYLGEQELCPQLVRAAAPELALAGARK